MIKQLFSLLLIGISIQSVGQNNKSLPSFSYVYEHDDSGGCISRKIIKIIEPPIIINQSDTLTFKTYPNPVTEILTIKQTNERVKQIKEIHYSLIQYSAYNHIIV